MDPSAASQIDSSSAHRGNLSGNEASASGVSWPAVLAGALVTSALSILLLELGMGLGMAVVSPWAGRGASASSMGTASLIWLIVTQIIAAATGGYVAGRLRTKWADVHNDEVFFRDTAHGFLVWSVGLVIAASLLASAAAAIIGGAAVAGTVVAAGAAVGAGSSAAQGSGPTAAPTSGANGYFVDALFRTDESRPDPNGGATTAEAGLILANGLTRDTMPAADRTYLAQLIARRTGLSQADAEKRLSEVLSQIEARKAEAKAAADEARQAAVKVSLWMVVGLLVGAFCASFAATVGGRERDRVTV